MKSHSHLFDPICSFENLYLASKKAEKGKRFRHEVAVFNARRAENLLEIQKLLRAGEYPFGNFRTIKIVRFVVAPSGSHCFAPSTFVKFIKSF
jgi:hypothetical protein